jgi:hypothetical protein
MAPIGDVSQLTFTSIYSQLDSPAHRPGWPGIFDKAAIERVRAETCDAPPRQGFHQPALDSILAHFLSQSRCLLFREMLPVEKEDVLDQLPAGNRAAKLHSAVEPLPFAFAGITSFIAAQNDL